MKTVVKQDWDESERGWGIRPDGCSLHLTDKHKEEYIKEHWDEMPDEVPHEYSRLGGSAKLIEVSDELHEKVASSKNGVRLWQHELRKGALK